MNAEYERTEYEYIQNGGNNCPHCGSSDISGGSFEADGTSAWRDVECEECGESWHDIYSLTGIQFK